MCQKLSEGGLRCSSDTLLFLEAAEASGDKERIAIATARHNEASHFSIKRITTMYLEGKELIVKAPSKGYEMIKESSALMGERNSVIKRNIAYFNAYGKRFNPKHLSVETAEDPTTPQGFLDHLATSPDKLIRGAVASNTSASQEALLKLGGDDETSKYVNHRAWLNPSFNPDALATRVADPNRTSQFAAMNPSLPLESLIALATHESEDERQQVCQNPSLTAELLATLAFDDVSNIRLGAISNPSMSPKLLSTLSRSKDIQTRNSVARNPSTPHEVLARLSEEDDRLILDSLSENPALRSPRAILKLQKEGFDILPEHESAVREEIARRRKLHTIPSTVPDSWIIKAIQS